MDKLLVLIAEDNPVVAKTLEVALKKLGHLLVGIADNGRKALEMAITERPDIILMDIDMPELNGIEATRLILEQYSVPIIIVTSHEEHEALNAASDAGVSSFLIKPPNVADIDRAVCLALARHGDLMKLKAVNEELKQTNIKLAKALEEVKTLQGIIPICSSCKNILTDQGNWSKIEHYVENNSDASFSHGICPDCAHKLYPPEIVAEVYPELKKDKD